MLISRDPAELFGTTDFSEPCGWRFEIPAEPFGLAGMTVGYPSERAGMTSCVAVSGLAGSRKRWLGTVLF